MTATPLRTLPSSPAADKAGSVATLIHESLTAPVTRTVEPVGLGFMTYCRRKVHKRSISEDLAIEAALDDGADDGGDWVDEEESPELLRSDPLQWKEQDHYAVLGLSSLRYKSTDDDIKRAYRRKVLKHHPDKKQSSSSKAGQAKKPLPKGKKADDSSFFKCIQKAWEIISDPVRRRQFDSVDPTFDEKIPSTKKALSDKAFFTVYGKAFEDNRRFSKHPGAPSLGDIDSPREVVEEFYNFWFKFESWRTFEYLDEEDTESADSREDKRWLDKKNKKMRAERKSDDNKRITKLVEQAMRLDPRLVKFKQAEKAAKEAKLQEKKDAEQAKIDEARKIVEDAKAAEEAKLAKEKADLDAERSNKKKQKDLLRKEKKTIKRLVEGELNYFLPKSASPDAVTNQAVRMEQIFESLKTLQDWEAFRTKLVEAPSVEKQQRIFNEQHWSTLDAPARAVAEAEEAARLKKVAASAPATKGSPTKAAPAPASTATVSTPTPAKPAAASAKAAPAKAAAAPAPKDKTFTPREQVQLVKAVKAIPGGVTERWDKVAAYVNLHGGEEGETPASREGKWTGNDCVKMSKNIDKASVEKFAQSQHQRHDYVIADAPTQRDHVNTDVKVGAKAAKAAKK